MVTVIRLSSSRTETGQIHGCHNLVHTREAAAMEPCVSTSCPTKMDRDKCCLLAIQRPRGTEGGNSNDYYHKEKDKHSITKVREVILLTPILSTSGHNRIPCWAYCFFCFPLIFVLHVYVSWEKSALQVTPVSSSQHKWRGQVNVGTKLTEKINTVDDEPIVQFVGVAFGSR